MTQDVNRNRAARWIAHPLAAYGIAMAVMATGWTIIHYIDQPYKSPTYRRSVLDCLGYALWTTPVEGAGPAVPLTLLVAYKFSSYEMSVWTLPMMGGAIYALLALASWRFGRRWSSYAHFAIGAAWLFAGAIIFTWMTQK